MAPPCQSHHFCNPAKKGLKKFPLFALSVLGQIGIISIPLEAAYRVDSKTIQSDYQKTESENMGNIFDSF